MALNILKEADFRKELKTAPTGGYLFFGEEDYMKSAAIRMARQSVADADPAMATFNDIRLDGLDFTPSALLDAMTVPPMGLIARSSRLRDSTCPPSARLIWTSSAKPCPRSPIIPTIC